MVNGKENRNIGIHSSKSKKVHSFLCGQLDIKNISEFMEYLASKSDKWINQVLEEDKYNKNCDYYYRGYIDSLYSNKAAAGSFYSVLAEYECKLPNNDICRLEKYSSDGPELLEYYDFRVESIKLYIMPHSVVLYSIEITEQNILLNDITMLHLKLREVTSYESLRKINVTPQAIDKNWTHFIFVNYLTVIQPLVDLCRSANSGKVNMIDLVKNGNKLKLFQIVEASEYYEAAALAADRDELTDKLLFEMATLSMVGVVDAHQNRNSPSKGYYEDIICQNKIEPFRNWKALAIFDTFTVICDSFDDRRFNKEDWGRYFRLIYLHAIYQKIVLFELNQDFRAAAIANTSLTNLVDKMKDHECYYGFSDISYNFQPQMIYEHILKGLNVESERLRLHHFLEQENDRQELNSEREERALEKKRELREKRSDSLITTILAVVTILSIVSALNDALSLYMAKTGVASATCQVGMFICCSLVIMIIIFVIVFLVWRKYNIKDNEDNLSE